MHSIFNIQAICRKGSPTERVTTFCLHFIGLCLLFSLPEVILSFDAHHPPPDLAVYVQPMLLVAVFYINYYGFFRMYGTRHWPVKIALANVMLIGFMLWIFPILFNLLATGTPPPEFGRGPRVFNRNPHAFFLISPHLVRDTLLYILSAALSITIRLAARTVEYERRQEQQLVRQRTEELNSLKSQLRPHFLFNALNSVYALIDINPELAKNAVHRIGQLLRYVLYDTGSTVTLRQELDFISNYLSIMRIRLMRNTRLDVRLDPGAYADATISPLLFINLIENAFKHGCRGGKDDAISISITVDADGLLTCSTVNNIAVASSTEHNHGVGLRNLRRRLELLYGSEATLATDSDGNVFRARMTINLNTK